MRTIKYCKMNFLEFNSKSRNFLLMILLLIVLRRKVMPYTAIAIALNRPINAWGRLALLFSDPKFNLRIGIGLIFLLCDVPNTSGYQKMVVLRTGKKWWARNQQIFILFIIIVYYILIVASALILCLKYCEYGLEWGKTLITVARMTSISEMMHVDIPSVLITNCNKSILCFLYTFVLHIGASIIIIGILELLCLHLNRSVGIMVASIIIIEDISIGLFFSPKLFRYSIWSMTRVTLLFQGKACNEINLLYACIVVIIGIVISQKLCYASLKYKEIL